MQQADPGHAWSRCLSLTAACLLLLPLLPGALAQSPEEVELTPREELFLEAHGPIRHVVWLELPPTVFTDDQNRTVGVDADLRALMNVRLGLTFELVHAKNLSHAIELLETDQADTISPVTPTDALEDALDFTAPYISGGIGFWVDEVRQGLTSHRDLPTGARVAALPGAVSQAWLVDHRPDLTFVPVGSIEEGMVAVLDGDAEAYLGSFASVAYLMANDPTLEGLHPLGDMVVRADAAIAVPDGHNELLSIMNKGLSSVGQEDFSAIYLKWTGFDLSPTAADAGFQVEAWHWAVVGGIAGLTLLLAGATVFLRRQVQARTAELQESEARHRTLFQEAPVGLVRGDREGRIENANGYVLRMLGFSSLEEMQTWRLSDVYVDPADRDRVYRLVEAGGATGVEVQLQPRHGPPIWVELSIHAIQDGGGGITGFETAIVDITSRKAAETALAASEARWRSLVDNAPSVIVTVDRDQRITFINRATTSESQAVVGTPVSAWVHPEDRALVEARQAEVLESGEPAEYETRVPMEDGKVAWYATRVVPLTTDREITGALLVSSDITARKRAELELQRRAEELARSNAELERFAYVASHDLQEPIRMVHSYTQLIAQRYGDRMDEEGRELFRFVQEGAARMRDLVQSLLTYSRLEREGQPLAWTEAEEVLGEVLTVLTGALEESGATVTHEGLPMVLVDRSQLGQVFQNLVTNALKFHGSEAPRIHIACERTEDRWLFSVSDNGIGIEPEHQHRIFEVFQRLHPREAFPGTGIGLAICKRIVETHGGRIWVASRGAVDGQPSPAEAPDTGTTFWFTLPAKEVPPAPATEPAGQAVGADRSRSR